MPTGARWSVAAGQAITSIIVDMIRDATIYTCIGNIMVAAREGQEGMFVEAVRAVLGRIRQAHLLTSPDRELLASETDAPLLAMAQEEQFLWGERFWWDGRERRVSNSVKTVAKLVLTLQTQRFTCRRFTSLLSLEMDALHTTRLNPATCFYLLKAYRGVYRLVDQGRAWDSELPYLEARVRSMMLSFGERLDENP